MRAFIALELPDAFEDDVASLARQLSAAVSGGFSPRENYHLTLAFLGEIGEAQSHDAIAALDVSCAGLKPVRLMPEGLGHFGRPHDATLWLGISPDQELMNLRERVRSELEAAGLNYDEKPFRPHITLARRAALPKGSLPALAFPLPAKASRMTLFKSTLTQDGPIYKSLYTIRLEE